MSTDLSKLLQVNPLFFSLSSVRELVDFYNPRRREPEVGRAGAYRRCGKDQGGANLSKSVPHLCSNCPPHLSLKNITERAATTKLRKC